MNKYDEIRSLLKASKRALKNDLNENQNKEILKQYGLISEQEFEKQYQKDENIGLEKKDSEDIGKQKDKQKGYKIQGKILVLHGDEDSKLELTTDEKNAFIESVDEFKTEVAELVEFKKLNVFTENVEWSGKILELNLEFFYTINEPHGIYLNGNMVKLDQEYLEMVGKLQSNYEKFKSKWGKILSTREQI